MRRRMGRSRSPRRQVKWGGAQWFGAVDLNDTFSNFPEDVDILNFWVRWPSNIPDPANEDNIPEEDTWIKCLNTFAVGHTNGGAQANNRVMIAAGLIAWDSIAPVDNLINNSQFPNPFDGSWDWIWRSVYGNGIDNTVGFGLPTSLGAESQYISKAMRKLPPSTGVVALIAQGNYNSTTLNVQWTWDCRFAVKVEK